MSKIILKAGEGKRIKSGHKWIFSNEIKSAEGHFALGDISSLYDNNNVFIGKGFYNPHSLISFRLLTLTDEDINIPFWHKRIEKAKTLRDKIYPNENSYRAVFGESDDLAGIVIDKYGDALCAQFLSAGAQAHKADILTAATAVFEPKGIFVRNDSRLRQLENADLKKENEIFYGEIPKDIIIFENGLKFYADIISGQKTGWYFDQRDNRAKLASYVKNKKVLDCYCHTGAFGIYAKNAGAQEVVFVDSSRRALEIAEKNYALNGFKNFNAIEADALEYLQSKEAKDENFDIVNIDPPGLIKSKKDFHAGFKHYVKINEAAICLLKSGGMLATSSCSRHLDFKSFVDAVCQAAVKTKKENALETLLLEYGFQAKDHPILSSMPETQYLNFAIAVVK
ncbi:MAG: class I SAM-dependent rRNA methyltransferase [Endomicrobium sp.]|jgi:23S rRNA (cytosine1962-C5)-methyltransferase|nr:class I SAM-dependent rRNA methyltransferase [Endomicrobium sp.]